MPSHKSNPSHGQKVTSDPASKHATKSEAPGAIAKDSLAADSLRSPSGKFAAGQGNPGISGAGSKNSTFNAVPSGDEKVRTLPPSSQRNKDDESGHLGPADAKTKSKAGLTGSVGGGKQTQEAFSASAPETLAGARGSKHSGGSTTGGAAKNTSSSASKNSGGGTGKHSKNTTASKTSGGAAKNTDDHDETGTVGKGEDVDWSKIPKDTKMNPDEDPGRVAAQQFAGRTQRQGVGSEHTAEERNAFEVLESEEKT
ncbi:hypothetical protein EDC01DRAFT_91901 [Geopyxis carbonaria]|nr:hypothetical protein EDC01DRAFT_91901 [Geopyxis carbonaria]